jgi:hypothetical protein
LNGEEKVQGLCPATVAAAVSAAIAHSVQAARLPLQRPIAQVSIKDWRVGKNHYNRARVMKTPFLIIVSVFALLLGGCAEQPLMSDEEYNARHGPAPFSPDPMNKIPQPSNRPAGF